jgi:hypothetical protein
MPTENRPAYMQRHSGCRTSVGLDLLYDNVRSRWVAVFTFLSFILTLGGSLYSITSGTTSCKAQRVVNDPVCEPLTNSSALSVVQINDYKFSGYINIFVLILSLFFLNKGNSLWTKPSCRAVYTVVGFVILSYSLVISLIDLPFCSFLPLQGPFPPLPADVFPLPSAIRYCTTATSALDPYDPRSLNETTGVLEWDKCGVAALKTCEDSSHSIVFQFLSFKVVQIVQSALAEDCSSVLVWVSVMMMMIVDAGDFLHLRGYSHLHKFCRKISAATHKAAKMLFTCRRRSNVDAQVDDLDSNFIPQQESEFVYPIRLLLGPVLSLTFVTFFVNLILRACQDLESMVPSFASSLMPPIYIALSVASLSVLLGLFCTLRSFRITAVALLKVLYVQMF